VDHQHSIHFPQVTIPARIASRSGKDNLMKTPSDLFEDVALVYIRLVSQESQEAAVAIEEIQAAFGSRAALRAALIITILKIEVQQNHWLPNIGLYAYLLADYPDALPLTEVAMRCCLQKWGISVAESSEWANLAD